MKQIAKILACAAVGAFVATSAMAQTIVVGGKDFTEQLLLTEITAQLLEANGFTVDRRNGMGSQVVRDAQVNGQVDLYWEYTGTSLVTYNHVEESLGAVETYARVKELDAAVGLTWLDASAANNTYALAVQAENDRTDGINTLSDLAASLQPGRRPGRGGQRRFPARRTDCLAFRKPTASPLRVPTSADGSGLTYQALNEGRSTSHWSSPRTAASRHSTPRP